jgi:hypothetical protein
MGQGNKRPLYETPSDRGHEFRAFPVIAGHLSRRWRAEVNPKKMPSTHFSDCVMIDRDGKVRAYIEYKKRGMKWGDYPTIMLSASKYLRLDEVRNLPKVGAYFAVEDRTGSIRMVDLHDPLSGMFVVWGGRTASTRDTMDIEPVCHFPVQSFEEVGNVNDQGSEAPKDH